MTGYNAATVAADDVAVADGDFQRGAQAMREMLARFIEQGGDATTAESVRANWHPGWGENPGAPSRVVDTSEPLECPEGEALYAAWRASSPEHLATASELSDPEMVITMLERWAIPMMPANALGQISLLRGMVESSITELRKFSAAALPIAPPSPLQVTADDVALIERLRARQKGSWGAEWNNPPDALAAADLIERLARRAAPAVDETHNADGESYRNMWKASAANVARVAKQANKYRAALEKIVASGNGYLDQDEIHVDIARAALNHEGNEG